MGLNDTGYEGKRGVKDVSWVISLFNHFMQWERMWMESQVLLISEPWGILTLQAGKKESEKKEPPECHRPTMGVGPQKPPKKLPAKGRSGQILEVK